jgi:hypothetical protein
MVSFAESSPPTPHDLERLVVRLRTRITRHLEHKGALADAALDLEPSAHQACLAAATSGHDARSVRDPLAATPKPRVRDPHTADCDGFSLHAGGRIDPLARYRLEQLLSYCARPPIANGSLSLTDSGQVVHRLKKPWRDGTTHVALGPLAFIQRLCALVPARAGRWSPTTVCSRPPRPGDRRSCRSRRLRCARRRRTATHRLHRRLDPGASVRIVPGIRGRT